MTQPQPSQQTVITIQQQEIDRINSNRVFLLATLDEVKAEANAEIGRLVGIISELKVVSVEAPPQEEATPPKKSG